MHPFLTFFSVILTGEVDIGRGSSRMRNRLATATATLSANNWKMCHLLQQAFAIFVAGNHKEPPMKGAEQFSQQVWLLNTIHREKNISLAEINELWIHTKMSGGVELNRHTFIRYKNAIEEAFGVIIECDRKTNRYFISNPHVLRGDSMQRWMLAALTVSNIISESLSLQDCILLENIPVEDKQLSIIIEALKQKRRISFCYQKYSDAVPTPRLITPCCIKLFRQRWYVIDFDPERSPRPFKPFAFDRLSHLQLTDQSFELPADFHAHAIFTDAFGIFIGDAQKPQRIVIRAYGEERFYMRDLPLHHSQEVLKEGDDYTDYKFFIRPSKDFVAELLSKGNRIEVLEPEGFRERIREEHLEAAKRYKKQTKK